MAGEGLQDQRLQCEIDKLRAETLNLRRPAWHNPATLVAIVTAVVALLGAGFTYQRNHIQAERASLGKERIDLEAARLRDELAALQSSREALLRSIEEASAENEQIAVQAQLLRQELAVAEASLARAGSGAPSESPSGRAIHSAREVVAETQAKVRRFESSAARREQLLTLQADVKALAKKRPAAAH
jgi:hypothetical protein